MCGIAGFADYKRNFLIDRGKYEATAKNMADRIRHRGPDDTGVGICEHTAFSHARLAVIDVERGKQPMSRISGGYEFVITYNGELYNTEELRRKLKSSGYIFTTDSDTEVLLYMYIHYGADCVRHLNGIYAFCVWDAMRQRVFAARDRFGVKPFFYTMADETFVFASEIKALFEYPGIKPEISDNSLREIFAISPPRTQ
ncbi:MAG: asparagine synthetase B, partial [Oscillospiraceae bacterium]|nr:asparagine synthetase B [Oscillospiraceae bacterium]